MSDNEHAPDDPSRVAYGFSNVEIVGGGFVTGLVAHPRVRGLFYARTDVGGAYRRETGDERWVPITDWIGQREWRWTGVESVALDPNDPDRVLLALGIYNDPKLGHAVVARSNDRGRRFELTPMPCGMGGNEAGRGSGERLAVDPHRPGVVLFGSRDRGLFRSDDFGATFREVASFPRIDTRLPNPTPERWNYLTQAVGVVFVLFDAARAGTIYAGVSSAGPSLYRSTDGGESWHPIPEQPAGLRPIRGALAGDGVLYVTYGREPGPNTMHDGAVHRLCPREGRWTDVTPIAPRPERGEPFGYAGISVDAANSQRVLVATAYRDHAPGSGGDELFYTTTGGASWHAIGQAAERDASRAPWMSFGRGSVHLGHWMYAVLLDPFEPERAYYATGQTVWACSNLEAALRDEPTRWIVDALGIEETVPLALASPEQGAHVVVGTGDISGFTVLDPTDVRSNPPLFHPTFKDTTGLDVAAARPELVVRVGSRGWNRERDRDTAAFSLDGGRSWHAFEAYPEPQPVAGHVAVSSDGESWVWWPRAGAAVVTRDASRSFNRCRGLPEGRGSVFSDRVDPSLFYAFPSDDGRVFVSADGGESFEPRAPELPGAPFAAACALPGERGRVVIAAGDRVFESRDAATTWHELAGFTAATHVGAGRAAPGGREATLFVVGERGDAAGFFRSTDAGRSWALINDAEHRFGQIRALCGDPKRFGRLYIATGGRGVVYGDPR